jgi:hypothetical protein
MGAHPIGTFRGPFEKLNNISVACSDGRHNRKGGKRQTEPLVGCLGAVRLDSAGNS